MAPQATALTHGNGNSALVEVATGGRSLIFLDLIWSVSTLISLSGSCNNIIDSCLDINTKPFLKHVLFLLSVQKKGLLCPSQRQSDRKSICRALVA